MIAQTTTIETTMPIEVVNLESETEHPEPIRVIRNGQWVVLQNVAELSDAECRAIYVAAFNIYA